MTLKQTSWATISVVLMTVMVVGPVFGATYKLDPSHSSVVFRAKHMDIGYVYGMFLDYSGTFKYDAEKPEETESTITIQAESVFTNVRKRDNHLKGPDFFNAKEYPTITFQSQSATQLSDTEIRVTGELSMHGVTKPLTITVELTGSGKGPEGNFRRGFHSVFTVNRLDYGVDFMPDGISKNIKLIVSGEAIRQ